MEEAEVKKEMGKRLVDAMEPAEAKRALLEIVFAGTDPYIAILGEAREAEVPDVKKKRKKWTRKTKPIQLQPMPGPHSEDLPF